MSLVFYTWGLVPNFVDISKTNKTTNQHDFIESKTKLHNSMRYDIDVTLEDDFRPGDKQIDEYLVKTSIMTRPFTLEILIDGGSYNDAGGAFLDQLYIKVTVGGVVKFKGIKASELLNSSKEIYVYNGDTTGNIPINIEYEFEDIVLFMGNNEGNNATMGGKAIIKQVFKLID